MSLTVEMQSDLPARAPAARLPDWSRPDEVAAAIDMIRRHPRFDEARMLAIRGIVDGFRAMPVLNLVMNDRGRFLFLTAALGFHVDPDPNGNGLLPSRLLAFCEEGAVCSRGRAKAMLAALRWAGYLDPAPPTGDGRARPLVPTESMMRMVRDRWRAQIRIAAVIEPGIEAAGSALEEDPIFVCYMARAYIAMFRQGFRLLDHAPALKPLAERNAGIPILLMTYLAAREATPPPSIAALSRRFGVSRAHVRETLRAAQNDGLLASDGDAGDIGNFAALDDNIADFFAATLLTFIGTSTSALAERAGVGRP